MPAIDFWRIYFHRIIAYNSLKKPHTGELAQRNKEEKQRPSEESPRTMAKKQARRSYQMLPSTLPRQGSRPLAVVRSSLQVTIDASTGVQASLAHATARIPQELMTNSSLDKGSALGGPSQRQAQTPSTDHGSILRERVDRHHGTIRVDRSLG